MISPDHSTPPTLGAILAGGLARRLGGGDKALRIVRGRTVLARLVERMAPQVTRLILNANDDPCRFDAVGLPTIADSLPGYPGPLAGVIAALDWAASSEPATEWVVTVPGDAPFLPTDLVARLHAGRRSSNAIFACAASNGWTHPVVGLWPVSVREELRRAVAVEGVRKIGAFTGRQASAAVEWPATPVDPFLNVNTPDDLAKAERLAAAHPEL